MPGGDGTGPRGLGPGTGRGYGPCGAGGRFGRGRGFGRGFGPGRGFGVYQRPLTQEEEKSFLVEEATGLESDLKEIKQRLKNLESKE